MSSLYNSNTLYFQTKFFNELSGTENLPFETCSRRPLSPVRFRTPPRAISPTRFSVPPPAPKKKLPVQKTIDESSIELLSGPVYESNPKWIHVGKEFFEDNTRLHVYLSRPILDAWVDLTHVDIGDENSHLFTHFFDKNASYVFKSVNFSIQKEEVLSNVLVGLKRFERVFTADKISVQTSDFTYNKVEQILDTSVRVTVNLNWGILELLGKNLITFEVRLKNLQEASANFFVTFRNIARSEPILNDIFNQLLNEFKSEAQAKMELIFKARK